MRSSSSSPRAGLGEQGRLRREPLSSLECTGQRNTYVALGVEYDGTRFNGFQRQSHAQSAQGALEAAISKVANEPIRIVGAGRTDAGVHATQQVVSFQTSAERPTHAWRRGVSSLTPRGIGVVWARVQTAPFHARFDAIWRRYVYVWSDATQTPVILRGHVAWARAPLDVRAMHDAAQCLLGEHDFSAFRAAGCQSRSPWRCITSIEVKRVGSYVALDVTANAFLMHMVRNIAGALREVGAGALTIAGFRALFERGDRTLGPPTAPSAGLYLVGVGYRDWRLEARMPPML